MAVTGMVAVVSMILQAATGPAWWMARGVVNTNATPNDFAAVNQGQLKWMAVNAALELESQLPGGAGSNVWALIDSFSNTNNFRPVNLGQLKYVASHFYDRLMEVGYTTNYPWSGQPNDYALANIGQMKNVFSFDAAWWMTLDSDEDGIPDWWLFQYFGHTTGQTNDLSRAEDDADGDGSSNYEEYLAGTNPLDPDSMPADNPDKALLDSFNYSQVNLLRAVVGLEPTPWTFATNNSVRINQLRTSVQDVLTNFIDLVAHPYAPDSFYDENGGTNVFIKWTLESILNHVSGSGSWLAGPVSNQVNELSEVIAQLICTPSVGTTTYEGVDEGDSLSGNFPYVFHSWTVLAENAAYPSIWPTNFLIRTYIQFEEKRDTGDMACDFVDDALVLNCSSFTNGFIAQWTLDVTADWLPNTNNYIEAVDLLTNKIYCTSYHMAHVLQAPRVSAKFLAKEGKINHGFDPTEGEPWTSVGVGSTNQIVQLQISSSFYWPPVSPPAIELVVRADSTNKVSVTPMTGLGGTNNLTIIGKLPTTNAVIEVRVQGMTNALATLHVMVLPWVTNSVGIYRVEDPASTNTWHVGGPAAADIISTLNGIYTQACVHFTLATNTIVNLGYDDGQVRDSATRAYTNNVIRRLFAIGKNGMMELGEEPTELNEDAQWTGQRRVFLFNSGNITYGGSQWRGYARLGARWCVVFSGDCGELLTPFVTAHEMGHQLQLSTRNNDGKYHDCGTPPNDTGILMRPTVSGSAEMRWMRREDWDKANREAEARTR